ncbi:MAG: hypothetical protein V4736_08760 [Bdellovibrionota bacterium]
MGLVSNSKIAFAFETDREFPFVKSYRQWRDKNLSKIGDQCEAAPNVGTAGARMTGKNLNIALTNRVSRNCVEAALKMSTGGNNSRFCGSVTAGGLGRSSQDICYTSEMIDYLTWSFNSAIECMSDDIQMDARLIFMKMSNESLFNFSVASEGGVGLGQLTSSALQALSKEANRYITNVQFSGKPVSGNSRFLDAVLPTRSSK